MANGNNGYAPEDGDGFFSSLSGEIIELSVLTLNVSLEFTSGNSVLLDLGDGAEPVSYTYEKTGPNAARLVVTLDDDEITVDLEYESPTRFNADVTYSGIDLPVIPIDLKAGDDTLNGGADDDMLYGGKGDDILNGGDGNDTLEGGPGADMLDGGPGSDTASYQHSAAAVLVRLHDARAVRSGDAEGDTLTGIEHLIGSPYNDILAGDGEDNVLRGGGGHDDLYGGPAGGDDMMYGDNGDDRIFGGRGNDTLTGGEGNDLLKGGPGEDILIVDGDDMDVLYGGPDKDTFRFFPSDLGGGTIRDFSEDDGDVIDLTQFDDVNSIDDLEIESLGGNVRIEVSGTDGTDDYLTTIILSDFDGNLDNSDFMF